MSNYERSGERDLTVSAWHRAAFGDDYSAFDLDLVGMCGERGCQSQLYVLEVTRAAIKPTTWTATTAHRLNCPGYLVQYRETTDHRHVQMTVTQVAPQRRLIGDRDAFEAVLALIRRAHLLIAHDKDVPLTQIRAAAKETA